MHCYGAQHDLEKLITTHLFVISPNNSGSTFVKNVLATCDTTWNLKREGQHAFGFSGPIPTKLNVPFLWASKKKYLDLFSDPTAFDWNLARKIWYFQAFSQSPTASVFVEKSPPFLLQVDALKQHFKNAKFLFMVRNPFAATEGILRAAGRHFPTRQAAIEVAIAHFVNCFRVQKNNIERTGEAGIFFTYESMCAAPEALARQFIDRVPELESVNFCQKISVKGNYDEPLRNMNAQQIARLSSAEIDQIAELLRPHQELLSFFGYDSKP